MKNSWIMNMLANLVIFLHFQFQTLILYTDIIIAKRIDTFTPLVGKNYNMVLMVMNLIIF